MKIIIDTNVFMSGIFWSGTPAKILKAWHDKKMDIVLSAEILDEYIRVGNILTKKYGEINIDNIIELLVMRSKIFNATPLPTSVCRDPNEDMFIACAIAANVKIIVSGDLDLLEITGYQNIQIMKPRQYYDNYLLD
jgi:putative PIN family toxin of toxin-antitoxin system